MRTLTAARRALSFPFVPVRHLTFCHLASASMSSAVINRISGTCRRRGPPRAMGQISRTSIGYTLRIMPTSPYAFTGLMFGPAGSCRPDWGLDLEPCP